MNKTTILAISAVFVASILAITAFEAEAEPPSRVLCPAENVQHWVNFEVTTSNPLIHDTEPNIVNPTRLFVPVETIGSEVLNADTIKTKVAERLNELGYTQSDGDPVDIFDIGSVVFTTDKAPYSTICAEN